MSLILDALSRAEREKRSSEAVAPDVLAQAEPGRQAEGVPLRWWLAAVLAVALLLTGGLLLWNGTGAKQAAEPSSLPRAQSTAGNTPPAGSVTPAASGASGRAPALQSPPIARPAPGSEGRAPERVMGERADPSRSAEEARAINALYAQAKRSDQDQQSPGRNTAPAADSAAASQSGGGSGASTAGQVVASTAPAATEEPVDIQQVLRAVRAEAARDALAPHPAPLLSSLSKQFRDSVPTLMYLRHDYNTRGQSSVLINGELLREGGRSRQVEVREILPDSVILRFADQDFRLRSLNSWVNL